MLLTLMYHRVGRGKYANPLSTFEKQFQWLKKNATIVLPGDPLKKLNVCITFDDATYDFYHYLFPLLKKFQIKVLLAIPLDFIADSSPLSQQERLKARLGDKKAYCTWAELKEMHDSGLVSIASHSCSHPDLTQPDVDLEKELVYSKKVLEENFNTPVTSFVYPFGKWRRDLHKKVLQHYTHAFRIGNASNRNWNDSLLYRISADRLSSPLAPFSFRKKLQYKIKNTINYFRKK